MLDAGLNKEHHLKSLVSCHVSSGVRLRRIFFFQQGTPEGAYSCYVTEGVTPQKGKKTSKMRQLMHDMTLVSKQSQLKRSVNPAVSGASSIIYTRASQGVIEIFCHKKRKIYK